LGPIMLKPLSDVIERNGNGDERVVTNALKALSSIAERYPQARASMVELFEETLRNEIITATVLHKDVAKQILLEAAADALCGMRSGTGIAAVRDRAARLGEPFAVKRRLVAVLARTLQADALPHFDTLRKRNPTPGVVREINRLTREIKGEDGEDESA
jgi:hypothetical protein